MGKEILFGDGARKDAHNTDDLFERWLIRRGGELPEITKEPVRNMVVEEEVTTETQARMLKEQNNKEIARINAELENIRNGPYRNLRKRGKLLEEREVFFRSSRMIKLFIREWSELDDNSNLRALIESKDSELAEMAKVLLDYRIVDRGGVRISDEEYEKICRINYKIRDVLMARKLSVTKS